MKKKFLLLSLFLFAIVAAFVNVGASSENVQSNKITLFQEALQISRTARTREELKGAIERYKKIMHGGKINGHLLYNIGNSYFKLNELGYAILYWKRAMELCPGNQDIENNLAYGRNKRLDKFEPKETSQVLNLIFFWHKWQFKTRYWITLSAFSLFWGLLLLRLFIRKKLLSVLAVFCLIIFLGVGISSAISFRFKQKYPPAVIVAPETNVYQGNSETYEKVFTEPVHGGAEVNIIEVRDGWVRIQFQNGENGWIRKKDKQGNSIIIKLWPKSEETV